MAVDGTAKGRQYTSKTKLGQLWGDVWDEYEACERHGIQIHVIKVKSHETDTTKVPQVLQDGNNCADYHAGLGVRECPSREANRTRNMDSRARWFQEKMVQAILMVPKKGRHPNERERISEEEPHVRIPHITQRQGRARILKHDVTRRGNMLECQSSGQVWESTASSLIFSQGVCPGPKIYGPPQRDRP